MAYPASRKPLYKWLEDVDAKCMLLKSQAQQQSTFSSAGTLTMDMVRRFYDLLKSTYVFCAEAAAVPGIGNYVTTQKQNAVADPVTEFQNMKAQIAATISWLNTNVPQGEFPANSGNEYKLGYLFPADNTTASSSLIYTAAETAGYRTVLANLIATIG